MPPQPGTKDLKLVIGSEEWICLPALNLPAIKVRVDTGARTSALHAYNIQVIERDGKSFVQFDVHPVQGQPRIVQRCEAPLIGKRNIKSSNGEAERRYVIETSLRLGEQEWTIEVTLTNRDSMGFPMLLGRQAMESRVLVDPSLSYVLQWRTDNQVAELYSLIPSQRKSLKIVLLASDPKLYSNMRLMEAGAVRGHEMLFVNPKYCYMNINTRQPEVHYRGGDVLAHVDAVIPRLRPSITYYGCAVTRQFQAQGAFCLNDATAILRARDKLRSLQLLAEEGLDMPITGFARSPNNTKNLIQMVGGAPLVVKVLEGTQGKGVVLAETNKAAESLINAFKSLKANILVQQFIKEARGRDLRCFVIDGKVVGAMERVAVEGEFRANLHLGGSAHPTRLSREEKRLAIAAAKAVKLKVVGVDLIRSHDGPKILEVNASPGLEGIEGATGRDIAGMMIESIERHIEFRRRKNMMGTETPPEERE